MKDGCQLQQVNIIPLKKSTDIGKKAPREYIFWKYNN